MMKQLMVMEDDEKKTNEGEKNVSSEYKLFKRILLRVSAILGIALLLSGMLLMRHVDTILGRNDSDEEVEVEEPSIDDEERPLIIEPPEFDGYRLRSNPTDYQLELFDLLVNAHTQFYETSSDENLKAYASAIVQNFIVDFFTLSNKDSRTDIGGLQFFSEDVMDNFRSSAIDDFYLYLNQYLEIYGSESLPTVASTTILDASFGTIMIEIEDDDDDDDDEEYSSYDYYSYYGYEPEIQEEEVRTIVIDASWAYEDSTLAYISEFQTEARFVLMEVEDEGVRIFLIEAIEEECQEYDYWGNCLDDCEEFDYWGNCIINSY